MALLLGIDVGTTSTKSVLMDEKGNILSSANKGYNIISQNSGWIEQNANDWWDAVVYTVRKCIDRACLRGDITAISLSTQGGSMVPVDKNGIPIKNAVVWMDKRAVKEAEELIKLRGHDYFYEKTGWQLSGCYHLSQIKWLQKNQPDVYKAAWKFLSTIDYLNYKLTGRYVTDATNAGITNLFDIEKGEWCGDILDMLGIHSNSLPYIVPSGEVIGYLTEYASRDLGLSTGIPVISGGHDQYCASLGCGSTNDGNLMLSTGTAWVILLTINRIILDRETFFSPGRHVVKSKYGAMATVPTGGVALEWFRNKFCPSWKNREGTIQYESFKDIDASAAKIPVGAGGIMFFPHFSGSTCPTWSIDNRASLVGINLGHDRYSVARAVMEGVVFEMNWILQAFKRKNISVNALRMLGGAAKSELWAGMVADITGLPVVIPEITDSACIGAAILAGIGSGIYKSETEANSVIIKHERQLNPDRENVKIYSELFEKYKMRFFCLKELYGI